MEGSYIHSLCPIKDGLPAELNLPLEVVWASSELRYSYESFHKWSPTVVTLPQLWSGKVYLFITLKEPFQTECQGPCYLAKEELDPNLSSTNSKHLLKYVEMNWMCDLKFPFQASSQSLTEFSSCCSAKNANEGLEAQHNWALCSSVL